jgi:D-glycero-beta-D-manno-heptose 1-phosphate adenylyltransferase
VTEIFIPPIKLGMSNICTSEELSALRGEWRDQGLKVGFTCGAFDLLHAGHVDYLQTARTKCDRLIVAVNSDESVRYYKNPLRPIVKQEFRMSVIAALRCVDAVTLMTETRPASLIELLRPDIYIKGGDYQVSQLKSAPLVEAYGGACAVIPVNHEISTSAIVKRIQELSLYASPEKPAQGLKGPLVLLDRDGTLIANSHFLRDPSKVRLLEGVGDGLRTLQNAGFSLAVITNQQGMGLGYFDYESFVAVNSEMLRQLAPYGIQIARFYFCPHSLAEQCECRKPGTAMIERALADFHCQRENCFVIGDALSDVQAAEAAGCTGILLSSNPPAGTGRSAQSFCAAVEQIKSSQVIAN